MPVTSDSLVKIAVHALEDVKSFLGFIEPSLYQQPLEVLSGSSIGQHTRHIIEFYICLLDQGMSFNGTINYASRKRDYLIESQPEYAFRLVEDIGNRLSKLDPLQTCMLDCSEHGEDSLVVPTTIGRELIYNIEHTVHHLAIIKIALRTTNPAIELPAHFGVAPSTIRHRLEACAQ